MTLDEKNVLLKKLDNSEFLQLGAPHIAYVREVEFLGGKHFAVHAADGSALSIAPSMDLAVSLIQGSDMEAVTLH